MSSPMANLQPVWDADPLARFIAKLEAIGMFDPVESLPSAEAARAL